jgi:ribosomal protein L23
LYASQSCILTPPPTHLPAAQAEIRAFLESVYGLRVGVVRTLNVEGKKKRQKGGHYRRADFKKAYVSLLPDAAQALDA